MKLAKFLRMSFIKRNTADSVREMIRDSLNVEGAEGSDQVNLISVLMKARTGQLNRSAEEAGGSRSVEDVSSTDFTDEVMIAQSVVFFFGGLETLTRALGYAAYELAINPDVQEKLRNEIDTALEDCDGKLDYEQLVEMNYLNMVVSGEL